MLDASYTLPVKESGCDELTGEPTHKIAYLSVTLFDNMYDIANSYRFLRSAIDSHMESGKIPILARKLPAVGAYNWATTVGEDDVAQVQSSDSENDE
jgi:hypothetical protein